MKRKIFKNGLMTILVIVGLAHLSNNIFADEIDDPAFINAIIQVESGGNPNAISEDGCIGLMQISEVVLKEYNIEYKEKKKELTDYCHSEDLFYPQVNKFVGTWYLRRLKDHYLKDKYTIERLLAAYNCGPTKLKKLKYDISKCPKETRDYVRRVMKLYHAK